MTTPSPYGRFTKDGSARYLATETTAEIVNLAIRLGRPLLVEGEAGCGKTRLAHAIAEQLGLAHDRFVVVNVKSTTQARDLLYRFDALRRLQDAQDPQNRRARQVHNYIRLEPLGQAIQDGRPSVVLIDEVDKADIDFPNDLLDVLDSFEFDIDDLPLAESGACLKARGFGRHVVPPPGSVRPLVVITSNREKQLPEPFLRRCLYVQLDFPDDPVMLAGIVRRNLGDAPDAIGDALIRAAVERFGLVRKRARELHMQKLPATSELVDWVRVLYWQQRAPQSVSPAALSVADQAVLFKIRADIERYRARTEEEASR